MFRHIIAAVDFSPAWAQLDERLARLHRAQGARRVTLVHVLGTGDPDGFHAETRREHHAQRLAHLAGELAEAGWQADSVVYRGEPAAELITAARERAADLLLLGSRGHGRLHELLLGSTALEAARRTPVPLWVEPIMESNAPEATGLLVLATDGSPAGGAAETLFARLLPHMDRAIAAAAICDEQESAGARARLCETLTRLAKDHPEIETRLLEGDPATAVTDFARQQGADITLIGKRGQTGLVERLLGSTAEHICRRARRPVLLVPADWRD